MYELPVIQHVDAYGVDSVTALKFSVISTDRHIASVHARLNADQAVAVRQEKAGDGAKTGYLNIVTETENGALALRIAASDAADLAALLGMHAGN